MRISDWSSDVCSSDLLPKIELKNVTKRFGPKVVLDNLSLVVPREKSLVVIGGSGTRKSVMLKCVLGILRPDKGEIFVDGQNVLKMSAGEREETLRKFGMLFQGDRKSTRLNSSH